MKTILLSITFLIITMVASSQEFWITAETGPPEPFPCGDLLTDARDGKQYTTVLIGTQCWMAENLNVGTRINNTIDQSNNGTIEKHCHNDIESQCDIYGGLYQWNEVMQYVTTEGTQGICPNGWHIPTDAEWTTLANSLGGPSVAGGKMKSTGTLGAGTGLWSDPNEGATNTSGFTGYPGGYTHPFQSGFFAFSFVGFFWSSTEWDNDATYSWNRLLRYFTFDIAGDPSNKMHGYSVRCLNDL